MYALPVSNRVKYGYLLAVALWCASLLLPAAAINSSMTLVGYRVFTIGIDALSAGMPGWLANPLCLVAIIAGLWSRFATATVLSSIAFVLTQSSFYAPALARSRGMPIENVDFKAGFFVWFAACSMILATSVYGLVAARRNRRQAT